MLHDGSKAVRRANKLRPVTLEKFIPSSEPQDDQKVSIVPPGDLSEKDKRELLSMLEENLKDLLSKSSMGWDAQEKADEIFNDLSRLLLVRRASDGVLLGFSSFRFEHDDGWDLLYCYEIHVSSTSRRQGIARKIMEHLVDIARNCSMEKVILTALKANAGARGLYSALGYEVDDTSPDDTEAADYEILSKDLTAGN